MRTSRIAALSCLALCHFWPASAWALDYFELETYPYQTAAKGETEVEGGGIYTAPTPTGGVDAGSERTTLEVTRGLTSKTEVAAYLDLLRAPAGSWREAATRLHVRTRFFEKDELPVDLGFYAEVELPRHEINHAEAELRGIAEKDFGKWTLDVNPILHKVVSGAETADPWKLQYATSLIYRQSERWHPRLDLFGDLGYVNAVGPWSGQQHLLSPAVDIRLKPNVILTAGVGFGLTPATDRRLVRTRLEWEFY